MKYRIYIDETGNADIGSSANPNHRFLSLTGVIMDLDHVRVVQPELEKFKISFFDSHPDDPIVLHRKEIVSAKPPFQILKDPGIRIKFDTKLLKLLSAWDYKVITVCVDKKLHDCQYLHKRHPYHYCMEVLLERYIFFLDSLDSVGDVMAESRGGKEDNILKKVFSRLYYKGNKFISSERIQQRLTSCQLKVKNKTGNVAGLQIADLLAQPSRNDILKENGLYPHDIPIFDTTVKSIV